MHFSGHAGSYGFRYSHTQLVTGILRSSLCLCRELLATYIYICTDSGFYVGLRVELHVPVECLGGGATMGK